MAHPEPLSCPGGPWSNCGIGDRGRGAAVRRGWRSAGSPRVRGWTGLRSSASRHGAMAAQWGTLGRVGMDGRCRAAKKNWRRQDGGRGGGRPKGAAEWTWTPALLPHPVQLTLTSGRLCAAAALARTAVALATGHWSLALHLASRRLTWMELNLTLSHLDRRRVPSSQPCNLAASAAAHSQTTRHRQH